MTIPGLNRDDCKTVENEDPGEARSLREFVVDKETKGVGQQEVHVLGALAAA